MEKRLFYNIDNGKVYVFNTSHVTYKENNKEVLYKPFDYYIRGIISNTILHLRVYYPFNDIDTLTHKDILNKSRLLLAQFKRDIISKLKENDIKIYDVELNTTNENLRDILNTQYV